MTDNAFSYVKNRSLRELLAARGIRRGRLERSNRQTSVRRSSSLAARHRHDHRLTVAGETLKRLATSLTGSPRSHACTSAKRPASPSLALR